MAWDKTKPVIPTNIVDTPTIFPDNWNALEDTLDREHYAFDSALSGRHLSGAWGVCTSTTTCGLSAVSDPVCGAIAWDTTVGLGKIADGTTVGGSATWNPVNLMPHSRVNVYLTGDQTLTDTSEVTVPFNTKTSEEAFDTLSEFDISTHLFTAKTFGYYLVTYQLTITPNNGGISYACAQSHVNSAGTGISKHYFYLYSLSLDELTVRKSSTLNLSAGDTIAIKISPDTASAGTIDGGANKTFLKIYRLS
jgi:hypothetical protein